MNFDKTYCKYEKYQNFHLCFRALTQDKLKELKEQSIFVYTEAPSCYQSTEEAEWKEI